MPKKRGRGEGRTTSEHYTKLTRRFLQEPAWCALSCTAKALYPYLRLEWKGRNFNNNGRIQLSVRQAAALLGVHPNTAARAFHDLQRKGFLVVTRLAHLGAEGMGQSTLYELTEIKLPGDDVLRGRELYKSWRPDAEFAVAKLCSNNVEGRNDKSSRRSGENSDAELAEAV